MPIDAQDSYLESRILTADGIQLVQILYQAAIDSVELARECLHRRDIAGRSKAITKAYEIVMELEVSLDLEAGGELSRNLLETYCYLRSRLLAANLEQSEPPLEEVARLLRVILEAWLECKETGPARQQQAAIEHAPDLGSECEWQGYSGGYAPSYPPIAEPQEYHVSVTY
ncbi:flagellar export chaperone FliS [uncultured Paludibaculum sp.]|uniref:flagellar export chaperone FliS n=1 Tax=uncultured Paludibaculum sp. TaxID=1765020 RepID=UPI002AAC274F|nr:flagellar export chaperone FliS [uncultured Paludibaculum sp.]